MASFFSRLHAAPTNRDAVDPSEEATRKARQIQESPYYDEAPADPKVNAALEAALVSSVVDLVVSTTKPVTPASQLHRRVRDETLQNIAAYCARLPQPGGAVLAECIANAAGALGAEGQVVASEFKASVDHLRLGVTWDPRRNPETGRSKRSRRGI